MNEGRSCTLVNGHLDLYRFFTFKFNQMKKNLLILFIFVTGFTHAQNLPACDTLIIQCCNFNPVPSDTLMLLADNPSSVLFDYPGFVILDTNLDTVAKETVTYFGIGTGFQTHYLNILAPIVLPFNGTLELYTGFFSAFACSWPLEIPDTATSTSDINSETSFNIFPNPASDKVNVSIKNKSAINEFDFSIIDLAGREIIKLKTEGNQFQFSTADLQAGIYFLKLADKKSGIIFTEKLMVNK
jgi:hypothetical protein